MAYTRRREREREAQWTTEGVAPGNQLGESRVEYTLLSTEQNQLLTRISPSTPMGETMRRYWLPALLAVELPAPDCPPVRLTLLGEPLVAFRDSQGRLGILPEACPHRGASLWLGRNEKGGLRCVYHGWKFDVNGRCLDQMNEPDEFQFKAKVLTRSYPTLEHGGVIWTYMGPQEQRPPPPMFDWTSAPESHRHVTKVIQECNWLQALEGGLDVSHVPILHGSLSQDHGYAASDPFARGEALRLEIDVTDYGFRYFGLMKLGDDQTYVRAYHFVMPFTQIRPEHGGRVYGHFWVPIDDETCMTWNWYQSLDEPLSDEERSEVRFGNGPMDVDQRTFRSIANARNDYLIDRERQKHVTFTGIPGINVQDRAVQETMGGIVDRSREHLGSTDRALIVLRGMLAEAVRNVEAGNAPPGTGTSYYHAKGALKIVSAYEDWRSTVLPLI